MTTKSDYIISFMSTTLKPVIYRVAQVVNAGAPFFYQLTLRLNWYFVMDRYSGLVYPKADLT